MVVCATSEDACTRAEQRFQSIVYKHTIELSRDLAKAMLRDISSMCCTGTMKGYDFLVEMPFDEGARWVYKALRELEELHYDNAERFPIRGLQESLDALRKYRKERRKGK